MGHVGLALSLVLTLIRPQRSTLEAPYPEPNPIPNPAPTRTCRETAFNPTPCFQGDDAAREGGGLSQRGLHAQP